MTIATVAKDRAKASEKPISRLTRHRCSLSRKACEQDGLVERGEDFYGFEGCHGGLAPKKMPPVCQGHNSGQLTNRYHLWGGGNSTGAAPDSEGLCGRLISRIYNWCLEMETGKEGHTGGLRMESPAAFAALRAAGDPDGANRGPQAARLNYYAPYFGHIVQN